MAAITTFTKTGNKSTTAAKLDKAVFNEVPENHELLKQAYIAYLANGRTNNATTLTRGNVRGGGKKPWKQKGTGRARFGSSRNPIWKGGGITFGPTGSENYTHKLHTTAKRKAVRQALSLAAEGSKLIVIEALEFKSPKTSEAANLLAKIGATKNVLIVVEAVTPELILATRNLLKVKMTQATYLNVYDILNADRIVITSPSLKLISDWLGSPASKGAK